MSVRRSASSAMAELIVEDWHSECGSCGYGAGGWLEPPADDGDAILTPGSRTCPGCGVMFTRVIDVCAGTVRPLPVDEAA